MGLYFDQYSTGQTFKTVARTITETDVVQFAGLSGDYNPIHIDKETAAEGFFGQRIAHGMLVISVTTGMIHWLNILDDTTIALLEWQEMKFFKPVFLGDTIHAVIEVLSTKETSKPDRGIIQLGLSIRKQTQEEVISAKMLILMKRQTN
jgi:acyl dehydratase